MILRNYLMILSVWLSLLAIEGTESERWSRQTSNSEWIPLARPRSQQPQPQMPSAASNQVQLPALQSLNLPPALRQEYQQQLLQLHKTQESINKLLLLQQQVRAQQRLLQNQPYLPNVVGPDEERQQFRPNPSPNARPFNVVNQEALTSPQLSSNSLPAIYQAQQFKSHSDQEVQEAPSGSSSNEEKVENTDDRVQLVYVPAETLAQRGQSQEERNRDHKQQFSIPRQQQQQQQYQVDHIGTTGNADDGNYNSEYVQFPRGPEADQFFKDARQKELDRLNEERKEIQKQAKIQAAARQREQERARQRDTENKLKELARIEELAKQRELERIREARERARLEELERAKERTAKLKEEQARQAEIERLAALERQKHAAIEQSLIRQKEIEKLAREQEEERAKELAAKKAQEAEDIHQHHTETLKHKNSRLRSKTRSRLHNKNAEEFERSQETSTLPPPNQPPLAVFMGLDLDAEEAKVTDVTRYLKDAKTIAVVDQINADTPRVFVGPSNLGPPRGYAKFDLPYLSSLDTNRVERRVDKLPFFVAPLSFNPPSGYSKIPFPAPHIGSVIVNNFEDATNDNGKPAPNPLIEPNSFIPPTGQGSTYQTPYASSTIAPYSTYSQEQVTTQHQSSQYPTAQEGYKYRPQHYTEQTVSNLENQESPSISPYQEGVTASPQPPEYSEQSYLEQVTPEGYQRPNVVSSYGYSQNPVSTTPVYQESYSQTRTQSNKEQELTSQLSHTNQPDYASNRQPDNRFLHPNQQSVLSHQHHLYQLSPNIQNSFEDPSQSSLQGPVGPTQYNLPAELPPIHPQLPGLVNSLLDGKETDKATTTTTTPEPTTRTTETTTTNYRTRIRQRGRVTVRPTTSTTTSSPGVTKSYDRTRRPFNRSRSRYTTTTTEDYRETSSSPSYEPTKAKIPETTQRYHNQEQYRRPTSPKIQKLKLRGGERNTYETTTINQITSQETLSDEGNISDDTNNLRHSTYSHHNIPLTSESPTAYQHEGNIEASPNAFSTERDYSKNPNYPPLVTSSHHNERTGISQHYQDRYQTAPASGGYTANLESQSGGFEYDSRDGIRDSTPAILSSPADYNYYHDKTENSEPGVQTAAPIYSQILEYTPGTRPEIVAHNQENAGSIGAIEDGQGYNQYSEVQQKTHETALPEREFETTTELPPTTTAPTIIRQRVRARLGGRPRQDSAVQTQPRGPQEEYVRFSPVNTPSRTASTTTSRVRDSTRPRSKNRPNYYNQAQVQSEGNEYVRIQSANRAHPKTIVQAAAPRTTTSTTVAPLTTTEDTSLQDDDEYGFIRPPSFNAPHHQISSKFRAPDSQIQLQNVAPTDETAEDSSPTLTQIPKHRQKYQSPNRPRPTIKSSITLPITTPPTITETPSFTTKPRIRAEEPKNRLRTRVRRPGRRRTSTTSTTVESILDENNNLPLDENYPKIAINPTDSNIDRHSLYDSNYDTIPNAGSLRGPSRADYVDESYPSQEFMLNFGASSIIEEQQDQSQYNYHTSGSGNRQGHSGSRSRPYANQAAVPERDIYGSESQWSTKLSKSSFQPANQLNQEREKINQEKHYESQSKGEDSISEIITAQPEETMSVLVNSDNQTSISKVEDALEITTESADFGMKMTAVEMKRNGAGGGSGVVSSGGISGNAESNMEHVAPIRRPGRRRRVRVRVRPAVQQHDDFVTAESQHFNSAMNNLVQDQRNVKYTIASNNLSSELMRKSPQASVSVEKQPSTISASTMAISNSDESITPTDPMTINYTEIPEQNKQLDVSTVHPMNNEESIETKSPQELTTPIIPTTTSSGSSSSSSSSSGKTTTEISQSEFATTLTDNSTPTPLMTTMTIPRKSWDSLKAYNEWIKKKMEKTLFSADTELMKTNSKIDPTTDDTSNNMSEEESHPKNHRSEWSEVRYPTDRNIYGYSRSEKITPTTQVPGLTKSRDSNIRALSDYVQAIFDSMKNADGEHAILDNAPNLWNDDTKQATTTTTSTTTPSNDFSTVMDINKSINEENVKLPRENKYGKNDKETGKTASTTLTTGKQTKENMTRVTQVSETPTESSSLTEQKEVETTTLLQTTSEASKGDYSGIPTTVVVSTTVEPTTMTTAKNASTLLGAILRTSTSTKVSHMTEICYRGRCVMTKPRNDHDKR